MKLPGLEYSFGPGFARVGNELGWIVGQLLRFFSRSTPH